ncbi:MAG TPA: FtsX-like permease family protein [Opitutaceae bacterium]
MAWRDSKASRRRLVLFSLCIVFGVGALVALDSFTISLGRALAEESKTLLGADLTISSRLPLPAPILAAVRATGAETAEQITFSTMMVVGSGNAEGTGYSSKASGTRLVQLRGETGSFPFYGEVDTKPPGAMSELHRAQQTAERVAVVEQTLMNAYGLRRGDNVKLGTGYFRIVGALEKISGESLAITQLAPRVLVPASALAGTGLDLNGPLVRRRLAVKLPRGSDSDSQVESLAQAFRSKFAAERISIETVAGRRRDLGRSLGNIDGFLALVGFVALLLGAVGVASAVLAHVRSKIPTVALLRCIGVSSRQAFSIYLVQGCVLGLIGALGGGLLGVAIQAFLPQVIAALLPVPVPFAISGLGVLRGMAVGWGVCVLVCLIPLAGIGRVSPLAVIRAFGSEAGVPQPRLAKIILGAVLIAAITVFAIAQVHSVAVGAGFAIAVLVGFAVFYGAARAVSAIARRWTPGALPFPARQGFANLFRPQNRTTLLIVALGLATFLSFALFLTHVAFAREMRLTSSGDRPNLMFFDVQDDQVQGLETFLKTRGVPPTQDASVITMKISAVRGQTVSELLKRNPDDEPDDRRPSRRDADSSIPAWTLRHEYRSTARNSLSPSEQLVAGTFVGKVTGTGVVPISVDEGLVQEMHLKLADRIDWDVQGVPVQTVVGSIRSIDWRRLAPNFFIVFPTGALDDAPKFWVVAVKAPSADASASLQAEVVRQYPNVTAIDLSAILQTVDSIFSKVGFVVEFMAMFTVATAVVVLASSILAGRQQRRKEMVLLRTLGASAAQLNLMQATEYAVLGLLGALLGCLLGWAASACLARWVFEFSAAAPPVAFVGAFLIVICVTLLTGWLADRDLPRTPPLEAIRGESG